MHTIRKIALLIVMALLAAAIISGCSTGTPPDFSERELPEFSEINDRSAAPEATESEERDASVAGESSQSDPLSAESEAPKSELEIREDYRPSFVHGEKPAEYQKYIVLHDTEGDSSPQSVIDWWDGNGNLVAAHFIIGKDGSTVQCVPLDKIAHHAGFGDTGHNAFYGVEDESRDDKQGTVPVGSDTADYGMNSYSIGIELVHVGGAGDYPQEQLDALDALINYLDNHYGYESIIIDHKAWRSGNSDTSPEFAGYLANYQAHRKHT